MGTTLIERAIELSELCHRNQVRYDGSEYILHPRRVAQLLLDHGFDDEITQCEAHLHDTVELTRSPEIARSLMGLIYRIFGDQIGDGVFVLSENMGDVGVSPVVKTEAYKRRLSDSRQDIQIVKIADFLDNSTDLHIYGPESRIRRIAEADSFYIPLALRVAPTLANDLIGIIKEARAKYAK